MPPFGSQSMVEPLRWVLVRRPDAAFGSVDPGRWHYAGQPDLEIARQEHDALVDILRQAGARVTYHDVPLEDHADAIFVHDPCIVTDRGAVSSQRARRRAIPTRSARGGWAAINVCLSTWSACSST